MEINNPQKKIILITSGQPSLNPRLVKEADSLSSLNYNVTVLYAYWNDWGSGFTQKLLLTKKWKAICAGGHPIEKPSIYFVSRIIHKLAQWLFLKLHLNFFSEFAVSRSAWFLIQEAQKHKADLYIAHNLGALPAIVKAAKKYKAKCGFDAEDFHRQEVSDDAGSYTYKIAKYLEDKYWGKLDYVTTSSPLITEAYRQLYPYKDPVTLLNVFPKSNNIKQRIPNNTGAIKLFWFSQTIGANRGLNVIAKALKFLNEDDFELHLLGNINNDVKQEFIKAELESLNNVYFHDPLPPDDIIVFASQFDIGLASESNYPHNRDICLTNKIFTYIQAGLTVIASNTTAQISFINNNAAVGSIYQKEEIQSLTAILSNYQLNREILFTACEASLKLGRESLNWENESVKFLSLVDKTLNKN